MCVWLCECLRQSLSKPTKISRSYIVKFYDKLLNRPQQKCRDVFASINTDMHNDLRSIFGTY